MSEKEKKLMACQIYIIRQNYIISYLMKMSGIGRLHVYIESTYYIKLEFNYIVLPYFSNLIYHMLHIYSPLPPCKIFGASVYRNHPVCLLCLREPSCLLYMIKVMCDKLIFTSLPAAKFFEYHYIGITLSANFVS